MSKSPLLTKSLLAIALCTIYSSAFAQQTTEQQAVETTQQLETIEVQANDNDNQGIIAKKATSALKSDAPLFETAQSVSVITQEQLQQKQAKTLAEAVAGTAGVVSDQLGRRGWDDVMIRGQDAINSLFIDGLRLTQDRMGAVEMSGMEQVEVVKGPSSTNFGLTLPGGIINLVSKTPQNHTFYRGSLSYGSQQLKEATFDINYAPNQTNQGAFRINGRIADQNDPTDYIYAKNYYIAPSYRFNLGDKTDLAILASYQYREYLRQHGIPTVGTLIDNGLNLGKIPNQRFIGEPDHNPNTYEVYRIGYQLQHLFDNGAKFKQSFATQQSQQIGHPIFFRDLSRDKLTIRREARYQDFESKILNLDSNVEQTFNLGSTQHHIMLGLDLAHEDLEIYNKRCRPSGNFNLYQPVYGQNIDCYRSTTNFNRLDYTDTRLQSAGLYLRNRMQLTPNFVVNLAGRYDWTKSKINNLINNNQLNVRKNAFTGNISALYNINQLFAPYVSYSTSFLPVTDLDRNNQVLDPETGKQYEIGLKWQNRQQNISGTLAYFDLTRANVVNEDNDGYNVSVGEQRTKGFETEIRAELNQHWQLTGAYSYTPFAKITKHTEPNTVGNWINHVAKHQYNINTRYYPNHIGEQGWYIGTGISGQGKTPVAHLNQNLAGYYLFNVETGYKAHRWSANLAIKNLFDKQYYAGVYSNGNVIAVGNPRQINFTVNFDF